MAFDITRHWYRNDVVGFALWPLSGLYCAIARLRKWQLTRNQAPLHRNKPVVIVGNISVGGTGKTPMVIWLCQRLIQAGLRPGVVSRGYGGSHDAPTAVLSSSDPAIVGDEALVIARRTSVPVYVCRDRVAAANALLDKHPVDVIVSDDGMQHYRLKRDIEIAMIDGQRRFGNELCLPAGPLREPVKRLKSVDFCIVTGGDALPGEYASTVSGHRIINLQDSDKYQPLEQFAGKTVHAVAGLGNPERFFSMLELSGLTIVRHVFPDHHKFRFADINFPGVEPVIMTEKDAVKCQSFAAPHHWYLAIEARPDPRFEQQLFSRIKSLTNG